MPDRGVWGFPQFAAGGTDWGKWPADQERLLFDGVEVGNVLLLLDLEGPLLSYRTECVVSRPTAVCLLSESPTILNTQGNHCHSPVL